MKSHSSFYLFLVFVIRKENLSIENVPISIAWILCIFYKYELSKQNRRALLYLQKALQEIPQEGAAHQFQWLLVILSLISQIGHLICTVNTGAVEGRRRIVCSYIALILDWIVRNEMAFQCFIFFAILYIKLWNVHYIIVGI